MPKLHHYSRAINQDYIPIRNNIGKETFSSSPNADRRSGAICSTLNGCFAFFEHLRAATINMVALTVVKISEIGIAPCPDPDPRSHAFIKSFRPLFINEKVLWDNPACIGNIS